MDALTSEMGNSGLDFDLSDIAPGGFFDDKAPSSAKKRRLDSDISALRPLSASTPVLSVPSAASPVSGFSATPPPSAPASSQPRRKRQESSDDPKSFFPSATRVGSDEPANMSPPTPKASATVSQDGQASTKQGTSERKAKSIKGYIDERLQLHTDAIIRHIDTKFSQAITGIETQKNEKARRAVDLLLEKHDTVLQKLSVSATPSATATPVSPDRGEVTIIVKVDFEHGSPHPSLHQRVRISPSRALTFHKLKRAVFEEVGEEYLAVFGTDVSPSGKG